LASNGKLVNDLESAIVQEIETSVSSGAIMGVIEQRIADGIKKRNNQHAASILGLHSYVA